MIQLQSTVMRKLLRKEAPALFALSALLPTREQDGIQALATFFQITRHAIDAADSSRSAKITSVSLQQMFEHGVANQAVVDQPILERVIDDFPDLGLAWEAWCMLEEDFGVPRAYALEFIGSLQMDVDGYRPETPEDLLRYVYMSGGVFGLIACYILELDPAVHQGLVDAASAARLSDLANSVYRDFSRGRILIPTEWIPHSTTRIFSKSWAVEATNRYLSLAQILYKSAQESVSKLPFRMRLFLTLTLVAHRESRSSIVRKVDRFSDEVVRASARALWRYVRRQPSLLPKQVTALPVRDASMALRNQSLRLSRDLSE